MLIYHFFGQGKGLLSGTKEYVILAVEDNEDNRNPAPGFVLAATYNTDIDSDLGMLPLDSILKPVC